MALKGSMFEQSSSNLIYYYYNILLKISDSQTLVAFLHSAWTHVDGNNVCKCMNNVCKFTHVHFSSKSRHWYALEWKVWYACMQAAQPLALESHKPLFFWKGIKLKIDRVWNPANKNNLEVFTEISHRNSETSRSVMRKGSFLFCFLMNPNWA